MENPVEYRRKVRYSDTDAQGIVFNGNYFTYMDDAFTDYLEAMGLGGGGLVDRGFDISSRTPRSTSALRPGSATRW